MEAAFAARGRTPKGRAARKRIFQAALATIASSGAREASLDTIAASAGLTQAALRHHFPTRDELLTAVFTTATVWFRSRLASIVANTRVPAAARLQMCIESHLGFMESVDSVFWLEGSAYWIRTAPNRRVRNEFYRWMVNEYARMIGELRPALGKRERQDKGFAIVTLVLGSWITHGRGSSWHREFHATHRRGILVQAAMDLVAA
jgi:AcrR family transcriptional regulator